MDFDDEPFTKMRINTERVIKAVEKHPCLWNTTHPDYRDRERKQEAWQVVAQMVIYNFAKLSDFEKSNAERYVRSRWRTARDAYNKGRNSASNSKLKGRPYVYANRMKFLEVNAGAAKKKDGLIRLETVSFKEEDNTFSGEDNEISNDSINMTVESNLLEEDDPFIETAIRPGSSCSFMSKNNRQRSDENDEVDPKRTFGVISEVMEMFKNDDLAFFVSLLPLISTFDIDEKLSLRSEILKIVAQMRKVKQEVNEHTEHEAPTATDVMLPI